MKYEYRVTYRLMSESKTHVVEFGEFQGAKAFFLRCGEFPSVVSIKIEERRVTDWENAELGAPRKEEAETNMVHECPGCGRQHPQGSWLQTTDPLNPVRCACGVSPHDFSLVNRPKMAETSETRRQEEPCPECGAKLTAYEGCVP